MADIIQEKKMIKLIRYYTPVATFGIMTVEGTSFECKTIEPPWKDNKEDISCIPEGVYRVRMDYYHTGGYFVYEIAGVPERTDVKIHIGNTVADTKACVLTGVKFGVLGLHWAVKYSRQAFDEFMAAMGRIPESTIAISQFRPVMV